MEFGHFVQVEIGEYEIKEDTRLDGVSKFNILDVQRQIRFMNKVVIAVVPGWAVGGGHSLHVVCVDYCK